jgi:hypothetical protein
MPSTQSGHSEGNGVVVVVVISIHGAGEVLGGGEGDGQAPPVT